MAPAPSSADAVGFPWNALEESSVAIERNPFLHKKLPRSNVRQDVDIMRSDDFKTIPGGNGSGAIPVPFPNTEVKPAHADGTGAPAPGE